MRAALGAVVSILVILAGPTGAASIPTSRLDPGPTGAGYSAPNTASRISTFFSGGGHSNLRSAYVAPPSAPALAPDRLVYGVVGRSGPIGQVGPVVPARGSSVTSGIAPCVVAGCTTSISSNSVWGNQSISLLGNVSVGAGTSLLVYDATLTFTEPGSGTCTAYGFNVSAAGARLVLDAGANVTEASPATSTSWFLYPGSASPAVTVVNSTLNAPSNSPVTCGAQARWEHGITVGWANWSAFNGYRGYNANDSLNVTGGARHSTFGNGTAIVVDAGNLSFTHAIAGFFGGDLVNHTGSVSLNFTAIRNVTGPRSLTGAVFVPTCPGIGVHGAAGSCATLGLGVGSVYLQRTLFENWNLSFFSNSTASLYPIPYGQYAAGPVGRELASNLTIRNVAAWSCPLPGPIVGGEVSLNSAPGPQEVSEQFYHVTVTNITTNHTSTSCFNGFVALGDMVGSENNTTVEYSLFTHLRNLGHSEPQPIFLWGHNFLFAWNRVETWTAPVLSPLGINNDFARYDDGNQIYGFAGGVLGPGSHLIEHNWFANTSGQTWFFQVVGANTTVLANTLVNITSGGGFGVSVNSGAAHAKLLSNVAYGVYNYSFAFGSNSGGSLEGYIAGNTAFDVDSTSFPLWEESSDDEIANESGQALYLLNGIDSRGPYVERTSGYYAGVEDVLLLNDTIPTMVFAARTNGSDTVQRPPIPLDFDITVDNAFPPANLTELAYNFSSWSGWGRNPSFLNLTGFLGVEPLTEYWLQGSWVRGQSTAAIDSPTGLVAQLAAGTGTFTLYLAGSTSDVVTTTSTGAGVLPLFFTGLKESEPYKISWNQPNGNVVQQIAETSPLGVLEADFDPSAIGTQAVVSVADDPGAIVGSATGASLEWILLLSGAGIGLAIIAAVDLERRKR